MGKYERLKDAKKEVTEAKHEAAISQICKAWFIAFEVWAVCVGLWSIGYINMAFLNILCAVAACRALFKTGYFWRDIKF